MYLRAAAPLREGGGMRGAVVDWSLYEVYDLTVKVTWLRAGALVVNLLLVGYLVWTKRLSGVRGGKQAYEARLRTESFIEVEQAALAAAAPDNAGSTPR
jgi:hypothetical protein